jgi:ABC-type glycerol-3-phosphate transport system substrate-binding protein
VLIRILSIVGASVIALAGHAGACSVPNPARPTEIAALTNSFPVLQHLADEMRACSGGNLRVEVKLVSGADVVTQARTVLGAGGASPYQIIQVSNGTFTEFVNRGTLQPIDDLVKKYWDQYKLSDIPKGLWDQVTFEGKIYAIPFESNVHQLFYRKDIFDKLGIAVPTTYDAFIAAAKTIKEKEPSIEFPIAMATGKGFGIATEFANIYQGLGGTWFDDKGNPTFNDAKGVKAAEILKSMLPYMSPNALSASADDVMVAFQQGRSAMGVFWASRAATMDAADVSRVPGKFAFAMAPAPEPGDKPATLLWWDGYVIPKQIDVDRDLVFRVLMEATSIQSYADKADLAFYARKSIVTDPALVAQNRYWPALSATIDQGVTTTPQRPYFGLASNAVGANLVDALQGKTTIQAALDKSAADYLKEARSQGFL